MKKTSTLLNGRLNSRFATKKSNRKKIYSGIFVLLLLPYLGTTLAATVTISGTGSSTAVEFGQGSQVAITCDTTITSTIDDAWYSTGNSFRVESITLSGLNTTSALSATTNDQGCGGKTMTMRLYTGSSGSQTAATIGDNSATSVTFTVPTSAGSISVSTSPTNTGITGSATIPTATTASLVLTLPAAINLDASTITRISLETQ